MPTKQAFMFRNILLMVVAISSQLIAQQNYAVSKIPESLIENANSVVRESRVVVEISSTKSLTMKGFSAITVLNKNGNSHPTTHIGYDKNVKVKNVEAIVYDAYGKEIEKFKKRDFIDISAVDGGTLYSDNRMLVIDYTPASYPYTLTFEFEAESSNTAYVAPFYPIESYNSSVQNSSYKVTYAPGVSFRHKIGSGEDVIKVSDNSGVLHLSVSDLPAIEYEAHGVPLYEFAPHVLFALDRFYLQGVQGSGSNWTQFGDWMNKSLLNDVDKLSEATKSQIRSLVADEETLTGKARKVYEFVQDRTRYISVQIGIGGWKPMPAKEVDELGYGDCKALTNYTKALLEVAGVPSYYTVVNAGNEKRDIEPDFASIQGNHVILAIPENDDFHWLECTSQNTPFGFIGGFTDDRDVLIVTPEGGKIVHTKEYNHNESKLNTTGVVHLFTSGAIKADVVMESTGIQYDDKYLIQNWKPEEVDAYYKEYWDYIHNISLTSVNIDNQRDNILIRESITFDALSYTSNAGDDLIFNVNVLNRANYIPKKYTNRKQPLVISRGFVDTDQVKIVLPENFALSNLPEPFEISNEFGKYSSSITKLDDNTLQYNRSFELYEGTHDVEAYERFRKFRKQVSKHDNQKIILAKI